MTYSTRSFEVFAYVLFIPRPPYPGPHLDRILVLCRLVRVQGIQKDPPGDTSHLNNVRVDSDKNITKKYFEDDIIIRKNRFC